MSLKKQVTTAMYDTIHIFSTMIIEDLLLGIAGSCSSNIITHLLCNIEIFP